MFRKKAEELNQKVNEIRQEMKGMSLDLKKIREDNKDLNSLVMPHIETSIETNDNYTFKVTLSKEDVLKLGNNAELAHHVGRSVLDAIDNLLEEEE